MSDQPTPSPIFATTHWSVVLNAGGGGDSLRTATALEQLCRTYWYPLYAYVRRRGHDTQEAQDLTQEFFARLLQSRALQGVNRERGRFRAFLLASLNHFLANEWHRARTLKRGGGMALISFDAATAEERYRLEPVDESTPEKIYERRWALALLDQVLIRLRDECVANGKGELFEQLRPWLSAARGAFSYEKISAKTGLSEAAARQAVHRLRQRYRELLRTEIAQTVSSPQEIDDEVRHLFSVFG